MDNMKRLEFLKLLVVMPLAAPAIVTACGKTQLAVKRVVVYDGPFTVNAYCPQNPALVLKQLLKSCDAPIDEVALDQLADELSKSLDSDHSFIYDNNIFVWDNVRNLAKEGGFEIWLDGHSIAAKLPKPKG